MYCKRESYEDAKSYIDNLSNIAFKLKFKKVNVSALDYSSVFFIRYISRAGIETDREFDNYTDARNFYFGSILRGVRNDRKAFFAFRNSNLNSGFDYVEEIYSHANMFEDDKDFEKTNPNLKLYYLAYDEKGNLVGYSTSVSGIKGEVKMTLKYNGSFKEGSKYVIQAYDTKRDNRDSFQTYTQTGGVNSYYLSAPRSTSLTGSTTSINEIFLGTRFGDPDKYSTRYADVENMESIQASNFAEVGKCPYTDIYEDSCKPIPYSIAKQSITKAQEYTQELNSGYVSAFTSNIDISLPNVASVELQGINRNYLDIAEFDPYYERGDDMFFYAVDKNGIVRLSSNKGLGFLSVLSALFTNKGEVTPFLYGVKTTGLSVGDPLYIYYSNENSKTLIFINSGESEDGSFPFTLGRTKYYNEYPQEVDGEIVPCPKDIKYSIWSWLDDIEDDLGRVDSLQESVDDYQQSETTWRAENTNLQTQLDARPTQEEVDELQNQLDSRPTVTPNDSQYGAFFQKLTDSLTTGISSLQSSLGSTDADDGIDDDISEDDTSNFNGNDPFRYKNNKY